MESGTKTEVVSSAWARRYLTDLRRYLQTGTSASAKSAPLLGRKAVSLGMETLDVARVHKLALAALAASGCPPCMSTEPANLATRFFAEVIVPIEQTHGPARKADAKVTELTQSLRLRTKEATDSNRLLKKGVARRQAAETALKQSVRIRAGLLAEAQRLRLHLQNLTHEIQAAQENERKKTGRQLRDDIAQLLLAIQIRLLALNGAVTANSDNLKKEIAETQRIVKHSIRTFRRQATRSGVHHEA